LKLRADRYEFDDLTVLSGATPHLKLTRSTEQARATARAIATVIGPYAPVIDHYLDALSFAPDRHLEMLKARGARIVFAPTIDAALTNSWADARRGRQLSPDELLDIRRRYGPDSRAAGVYDLGTDTLIFPTAYRARDVRLIVLHELGHALTLRRAALRDALLVGLPDSMRRHIFLGGYGSLRQQVWEALAEGYVWLVDGRIGELPSELASELTFILQTVEEDDSVRFEFQSTPEGDRTASRVSRHKIIDETDPEHGAALAPMRLPPGAEAWDLARNELAARRAA
jgi:hypothetical protein